MSRTSMFRPDKVLVAVMHLLFALLFAWLLDLGGADDGLNSMVSQKVMPALGRFFYDAPEVTGPDASAPKSGAPALGQTDAKKGRDQIKLLLLDDTDLAQQGLTWPVPYAYHAEIFGRLGAMERPPAALFLDMHFMEIREKESSQFERMVERLCELRAKGTNVYVGSHRHEGIFPNDPRVEELLFCSTTTTKKPDPTCAARLKSEPAPPQVERPVFCAVPVALSYRTHKADRAVWEYDLLQEEGCVEKDRFTHSPIPSAMCNAMREQVWPYPYNTYRRSPALAMFEDQTERNHYGDPVQRSIVPRDLKSIDLALIWGTSSSKWNQEWMVRDGHQRDPKLGEVAEATLLTREKNAQSQPGKARNCAERAWLLKPLIPYKRITNWLYGERDELCPYHDVIPTRTLTVTYDDGLNERTLGRLSRAYVLYGTDLIGTGERIVSPVHGRLPATHLHAMALDNLIAYKGDYKRSVELLGESWWPLTLAKAYLFFAFVTMCLLVAALKSKKHRSLPEALRDPRYRRWLGAGGVYSPARYWIHAPRPTMVWFLAEVAPRPFRNFAIGTGVALGLAYIGFAFFDVGPLTAIAFTVGPVLSKVTNFADKSSKWLREVHNSLTGKVYLTDSEVIVMHEQLDPDDSAIAPASGS